MCFFPFLLFLKHGSQGTGRARFNPRAAAQPGTAALHRGQGLGGAGEGLSDLLGENSLPGETGWDEGGTVTFGGGMEPQLCQSGTPTQSGAGEGAHPNSLMPTRTSQVSQPSSCLSQDPALLPSKPREQRSPPACRDCAEWDGSQPTRTGWGCSAGSGKGLFLATSVFSHLSSPVPVVGREVRRQGASLERLSEPRAGTQGLLQPSQIPHPSLSAQTRPPTHFFL